MPSPLVSMSNPKMRFLKLTRYSHYEGTPILINFDLVTEVRPTHSVTTPTKSITRICFCTTHEREQTIVDVEESLAQIEGLLGI